MQCTVNLFNDQNLGDLTEPGSNQTIQLQTVLVYTNSIRSSTQPVEECNYRCQPKVQKEAHLVGLGRHCFHSAYTKESGQRIGENEQSMTRKAGETVEVERGCLPVRE
jgi:hypothetical protein